MKRRNCGIFSRVRQATAGTLLVLMLSGCGLDLFSSSDRNAAVEQRRNYRKPRPECSGLDLGPSRFTPQSFRSLIRCFNSNDSIPELKALVDEASDDQLLPVLDVLNEGFLAEPGMIHETRRLVQDLEAKGELEETLKDLGGILAEPARLKAILRFMDPGETSRQLSLEAADREAIEKFIRSVSAVDVQEFLRLVRTGLDAPAARNLVQKLSASTLTDREKKELIQGLRALTKDASRPQGTLSFLKHALNPKKWPTLRALLMPAESRARLERAVELNALAKELFGNGADSWQHLKNLDQSLRTPMACFNGGRVFQDPWTEALKTLHPERRNLTPFFFRFVPLSALHTRSFCAVSPGFLSNYPKFLDVLAGEGGQALHDFLQGTLEDGGTVELRDYLFANEAGWTALVRQVQGKDLLIDGYLLATGLDEKGMRWVSDAVSARLGDGTLEQYLSWLGKLSDEQWLAHLELVSDFTRGDLDPYLQGLGRLDRLFQMGESHVWIEGMRKLALRSLNGEFSARGLGGLANLPSFDRAVKLLHEMTLDGRAAPLMLGMLQVMGGRGVQAPPVSTTMPSPEKPVVFTLTHRQSRNSVAGVRPRALPLQGLESCRKIDLRHSLHAQWRVVQACEGNAGELSRWRSAFSEMARTSSIPGDSQSFLALLESEIRFPRGSSAEGKAFVQAFRSGLRSGSVDRGVEASAYLLLGDSRTEGLLSAGLSFFREVRRRSPGLLDETRKVIGERLAAPEAAGFFTWLNVALNADSALPPRTVKVNAEQSRVARWIRNKECAMDAASQLARAREVVGDYRNGISGWEAGDERGRARSRWKEGELLKRLDRALKRAENPRVQTALANIAQAFSLRPGDRRTAKRRWTAAEALKFFELRSKNHQLHSYIFPGEEQTRVRLVSSLDRLEIVLTAANFSYPYLDGLRLRTGENFALKFMAMIAEAYGDSPRELWPAEIQKRFPAPSRPKTQREVYAEMKDLLDTCAKLGGLPRTRRCDPVADPSDSPDVQRRETWEPDPLVSAPGWVVPAQVKANLYNLMRALPVIEENLPGSGTSEAGGMLFLRDLFYELYAASAPSARNPKDPAVNHLGLILDLGDVGFMRAFTYYFSRIQDPVERAAHVALLGGAGEILGEAGGRAALASVLGAHASGARLWVHASVRTSLRNPDELAHAFQALVYLGAEITRLGLTREIAEQLPAFLKRGLEPPATGVLDLDGAESAARASRGLYRHSQERIHQQAGLFLQGFLQTMASRRLSERWIDVSVHHPAGKEQLMRLKASWVELERSSEFRRLRAKESTSDFLRFLSGETHPVAAGLLRKELGQKTSGRLGQALTEQATQDPVRFERWMSGVFDALRSRRFEGFIRMVERHL